MRQILVCNSFCRAIKNDDIIRSNFEIAIEIAVALLFALVKDARRRLRRLPNLLFKLKPANKYLF